MPIIATAKQTFPDPLTPQFYGDVVIPDVSWDTIGGLGTPESNANVTGDHLFLANSQPSSSVAKEGDVWYDSANGNHPYKFVNGVWTSIQDTSATTAIDIGQWVNNLVFSSTDYNTVAWGTGTIKLKDGTTYSISAGNTGNMTLITYIFLDTSVSTTVLQTTTTATSAVGSNRLIVAVAKPNADTGKSSEFQVFGGFGQSTFISTDNLAANAVTANEITANTITANKMNISTLSAISADLGTITAGTITGGTFQTSALATTGIKFDSTSLRGYDAGNTLTFELSPLSGTLTASKVVLTGLQTGSSVDGQYLSAASVSSAAANLAMRGWTQTSAFSVTDSDTVAWGAGTFTASDGTAYSIGAGNTGNMAARTYIYLDIAVSTTAYQTTTTAANAVGNGKVMVATAINGAVEPTFQVFGGLGGLNVDGSSIVTSSITANEIAASTITAGKLSVTTLSSITADLGTITAGTVTGATIQTASSGTRFVMNSTSFQGINSGGTVVFEVIVSGGDAGDVIMGDDAAGSYAKWDNSAGTFQIFAENVPQIIGGTFGGDGSDGALSVSSGTTTIDLGNAAVVTKNYTSISITGTGKLAFSNPHAGGTIIILKSQGDVTITSSTTPCIDASGMGAAGGAGGAGADPSGAAGSAGTVANDILALDSSNGKGGPSTPGAGTAGVVYTSKGFYLVTEQRAYRKQILITAGSGGGGGSGSSFTAPDVFDGGAGGRGGGGLVIECGGAWNFTTTGGISVAGAVGAVGEACPGVNGHGGGGGGGGAAGMALVLYNTLTANTGTITISGGNGGVGGAASTSTSVSGLSGSGGGGGGMYNGGGGAGGRGTTSGGAAHQTGNNGSNGSSGSGAGSGASFGNGTNGGGGGGGGTGGESLVIQNKYFA